MNQPLRVLVVDDTVTYRKIASTALAGLPGVEVVGAAANGKIALQKIEQLAPDLLLLDMEMPEIDGLELLRRLRAARSPVGAIMLSALTAAGGKATMQALQLGAFDFVTKPCDGSAEENLSRLQKELRQKIDAYIRAHCIRQVLRDAPAGAAAPRAALAPPPKAACRTGRAEVVAVGISTGGPQALTRMIPALPADLRAPLLVVQHMPPVFTRSLADDLDQRCALRVCEAADGQAVLPGWVYFAPGGRQMKVQRENGAVRVRITDDPPENSCRPSVDYLFRSVAEVYGGSALGVIMTGMGNDGARGCQILKARGAAILAQDEATCVVFGMPREPIEQGIADVVAPLDGMAEEIARRSGGGNQRARAS